MIDGPADASERVLQFGVSNAVNCGENGAPARCGRDAAEVRRAVRPVLPFWGRGAKRHPGVITSYSIHYTKLYDAVPRGRAGNRGGDGETGDRPHPGGRGVRDGGPLGDFPGLLLQDDAPADP